MKTLIVLVFVTCISMNTKAQTTINKDTSCIFLKNLKFKHGVDTLVIKGILLDLHRSPPFTDYEERFLKKHGINIHKLSNSGISFQPENCTKEFSAPLMAFADKQNFLNSDNNGISIVVTYVVFEGYLGYTDHSPYVIVIKVVPKMPIGSM